MRVYFPVTINRQAKYILSTIGFTPHYTMSAKLLCRFKVSRVGLATRSSHRFTSTYPTAIKPSKDEISRGRLASRNLEKAIKCLHEDGLVVVEDAVPHEDLDHLNARMVQDARTLQSRGKDMPFNYNVGNSKLDRSHRSTYFTIDTLHHSPTRPSSHREFLPSLHLPQLLRNPTHNHPSRPTPQMDLLLRQLSHAKPKPSTPTSTHRRRLRPPDSPFRAGSQRPHDRLHA